MPRPFVRILQPSDPWLRDPVDAGELTNAFRGTYDSISVCDTTCCSAEAVMAAFYANRTGPTPVRPAYMRFTDEEVLLDGGRLEKTDVILPWPPEYNAAHHDITEGLDAVALSMAHRVLAEPSRCVLVDRCGLVCGIVELSQRADAPGELVQKVVKRVRRLHREEPSFFEELDASMPSVRGMLALPS